jgi:general secretion pathway protein I
MTGRTQGFTLLEVVVAIALLGLGLTAALELLGVGLRATRASGEVTRAAILARRTLDTFALRPLAPGTEQGEAAGYRWTAEVAPAAASAGAVPSLSLYRLQVRVTWPGRRGERVFELATLRAATDATVSLATAPVGSPGATRREGGR